MMLNKDQADFIEYCINLTKDKVYQYTNAITIAEDSTNSKVSFLVNSF